jgi:hypothetical protein
MTAANDEPSGWKRAWSRIRSEFHERFDNWWESIGYFLGMATFSAGGPKQVLLAFGLAFVSGGFGLAIEHGGGDSGGGSGHFWMWIGGFLIGLIVPISKTETRK